MSVGHLLFSAATTSYIMIAIQLEERDLISLFGDQYRRYRMQVSMLFPIPHRIISRAGSAQGAPTPRSH
jgi:methanethiol S-methyltransferase